MGNPIEIPAWSRWGKRRGLILEGNTDWPRGENGRRLCRWCKTEVPKRRRSWCSEDCLSKYRAFWSWEEVKDYVKKRDNETCQRCGTTEPEPPPGYRFDPWDVDHIVRVKDGGTDDPTNLRLLCVPCHVEVGYEQRGTEKPEPHPDLFGPPEAA